MCSKLAALKWWINFEDVKGYSPVVRMFCRCGMCALCMILSNLLKPLTAVSCDRSSMYTLAYFSQNVLSTEHLTASAIWYSDLSGERATVAMPET